MRFIIFDLEATCWPGNQQFRDQEIIEIGAIMSDHFGNRISSFESFVKPQRYPDLSPYCVNLTGIEQEDINSALGFDRVANRFVDWLESHDGEFVLCSWGGKDLELLQGDCQRHQVNDDWLNNYIDLKDQYHQIFSIPKRIGLVKALKRESIMFEGSHHRAMDDAENLFTLFDKHRDMWMY